MWIPGWPGTWDPPASVSCILKSQVCITTPIFRRRLSHRSVSEGYFKGTCPIGGVVCDVCWSSVSLCGSALDKSVE